MSTTGSGKDRPLGSNCNAWPTGLIESEVVMAEGGSEPSLCEELVPKRKGTSLIWKYFGFKRDDVLQAQVFCKTCNTMVATTRGNTTNLYSHLQHKHKPLYEEVHASNSSKQAGGTQSLTPKIKISSIEQSFAAVTPYEKHSKRHKEITGGIARYLTKDMIPMSAVSGAGFVDMIGILDRRYQIPSRNYFSQVAIPQMYDTCRKSVMLELSGVDYFASTTDLWSSRNTEPYMSFTVHFLTQDFELKTRCMETMYFPDAHTGENIALGLREVLASWNLREDQQVCITTDNGANIVKATELNSWLRLQCFGHRLHLAIGK